MQGAPAVEQWLLDAVVDIARLGGDLTLKWFRQTGLEVEAKRDGTPVTEADRRAELEIRSAISSLTPGAAVIGEEHGQDNGDESSAYTWHVDPIDGTKAFTRGVPLYSTLLAVSDEFGPAAGAIYIPATQECVWAGRGLGCHSQDGPARVSAAESLEDAFVSTSGVSRWPLDVIGAVQAGGAKICGWGDGYGFLMAATGRIDAMMDLGAGNQWDFAPMPVIFSEAGGVFSSAEGQQSIATPNGLGANTALNDALVNITSASPQLVA